MYLQIFLCLCLVLCAPVSSKRVRIIGGTNADREDFPYQASLKRVTNEELLCGGAILTHVHIITTAHCVDGFENALNNLKIVVGNTNSSSFTGISFYPNRIYIHDGYSGNLNPYNTIENDIAVLKIYGYIEYNAFVSNVRLPLYDIITNDIGVLSGWGTVSFPVISHSPVLQKTWMRVLSNQYCQIVYPGIYWDQFCGFQRAGVGPCFGDGGSPLVNGGRLIGLISLSSPCATGIPDVYTNVYLHLGFIMSIIHDHIV